jgi:hypothetical protein
LITETNFMASGGGEIHWGFRELVVETTV